ncbi:MAG: hypothetical protein HN353_03555 [Bdellovibrionales bacterium]|jgi:hypothetical protein|nr:hypothetical protein [Bdellovibrionales bacterium]MBT3526040.1 hypothetical protein [Bdellovibrionales bacterium]MBT7668698.1 hypothetical protein [Bdellovibrionales bacterium]MBT7765822.1 hypothetical protein [Bdellovibrionales bacterium]
MELLNHLTKRLKPTASSYRSHCQQSAEIFGNAVKTSSKEFLHEGIDLIKKPTGYRALQFILDSAGSSVWAGHSGVKFLATLAGNKGHPDVEKLDSTHHYILNKVICGKPLDPNTIPPQHIFGAIYNELKYAHHHRDYQSFLECPAITPTIVLISGVFNEFFKTAAFERGTGHLARKYGFEYIAPRVHGAKGISYNQQLLADQLYDYIRLNPGKKLWLIAYSKGGVDALHFLKKNREFANQHICGFSSIAAPILGTNHLDHRFIRLANKVHRYKDTSVYQSLDKRFDLLAKEFQQAFSKRYQGNWFKRNHTKLPQKMFYTSIALQAEWHESHIWMMLAKLLFPCRSVNDGIVDVLHAQFPAYFKATNLGVVNGHHLIGARSTFYSQEALIEAHIIFMHYMKMI